MKCCVLLRFLSLLTLLTPSSPQNAHPSGTYPTPQGRRMQHSSTPYAEVRRMKCCVLLLFCAFACVRSNQHVLSLFSNRSSLKREKKSCPVRRRERVSTLGDASREGSASAKERKRWVEGSAPVFHSLPALSKRDGVLSPNM